MFVRMAFIIVAAAFMVEATARADDTPETWTKAVVYLPKSTQPTTVDKIPGDPKWPVMIYLHGCNGLGVTGSDSHRWARLLSAQGLLVIMPDSLARGDRKPSCDPAKYQAGLFPPVYGMRLAETRYAAELIRAQPWFNGKLLLMGHSEGGFTAALTPLPGFDGIVISGWTCTSVFKSRDGIYSPPDTPVLAINYTDDPWYPPGQRSYGNCEPKLAGRPNSKSILLPGRGHNTYDNDVARKAVTAFITERMAP